jgi:hypothetical protein
MSEQRSTRLGGLILRLWPWFALLVALAMAVWHDVDFPEDVDPEFPQVVRPTFNHRPPPAYRLAEPGDTLDRIAIYLSTAGVVFAVTGLSLNRRGLWQAALVLSLAAWWHASTPGPTFDGWHGLGWRAIFDPAAPTGLRWLLGSAALAAAAIVVATVRPSRGRIAELWGKARERRIAGLLVVAAVLVVLRQFEIPGVEPVGYWPRSAFLCGLLAFDMAMVRALPRLSGRGVWVRFAAFSVVGICGWVAIVVGGVALSVYHRPIDRLRAIVPGRIFMCAMPTKEGLEIVQRRHHIKTIINLFPEDTEFRSSRLPEEMEFARTHGITYVVNDSDPKNANKFLDQTLRLAQDPAAWPVLVHCHACMDRTPAWWGIYRFIVQGDDLAPILRDIERHRGLRPKASVTLLYNRVLAPRAPAHYRADPTAAILRECAKGTRDPFFDEVPEAEASANFEPPPRVSRRERPTK